VQQELQAKSLEIRCFFHGDTDLSDTDLAAEARALAEDPRAFCVRLAAPRSSAPNAPLPPVTTWQWPRDLRRCVMTPPGHLLLLRGPYRFLAEIRDGTDIVRRETSLPAADGTHFVLLLPLPVTNATRSLTLATTVYEPGNCRREESRVLCLDRVRAPIVRTAFAAADVRTRDLYAIATNARGAFAQVRGAWGEIRTQYDAFLAANLHPEVPVDRHVMLTRCRAWLVCRGYSHALASDSLESFEVNREGTVAWRFLAPAGNHRHVRLEVSLRMPEGHNAVTLRFHRRRAGRDPAMLEDTDPVRIIVRPDIEDRNAHGKTKAYTGPETAFPAAVTATEKGFEFRPAADRCLEMAVSAGTFTREMEWTYMVGHPQDAERGLDGASDLFSPGYFAVSLRGGAESDLCALVSPAPAGAAALEACMVAHAERTEPHTVAARMSEVLRRAMRDFLVKRDASRTVIAGYPWFLDWGRDTLICLRGLLAAGHADEAAAILRQFARFEADGTLPNTIRGNDQSNRDTSDAPLWFFVACADLLRAKAGRAFLQQDCDGRTVLQVLQSIGRHYRDGTPNGIRMDPDTCLIFSPKHFTWMDTNFPAGTPREGYPVEIQALWHAALSLLARADPRAGWMQLAERVRASILSLYWRPDTGFLTDCLHAAPGVSAATGAPDDHLRPNQLLAVTLNAVREPEICRGVLTACEELLVPGAIRSLADRPATYPLPVRAGDRLLNDPHRPYWGRYAGDEDTQRKPAYHNGTAWTWLFPSYCEALALAFGKPARPTALALLSSAVELLEAGCVCHVPEITDGDAPHAQRGCGAQAWSATELYRVLCLLTDAPHGARATTSCSGRH
jgi:predicted glycogen debranching enzyme